MRLVLLISAVILALSLVIVMPALSASETTVSATVGAEVVSITLAEGYPSSIGYGTLALGTEDAVPVSPSTDPILGVTNNGTVSEDFFIKGANATAGGNTWVLAATPGADQYVHKFGLGTSPTLFTPLTLSQSDNQLYGSVPTGALRNFKLRLSMPTSTSGTAEHSTTVTVVATAG